MTSDRFQRCEELFHSALALEGAAREAFLQAACAADVALRAEVERLLERPRPSGGLHRVSRRASLLDLGRRRGVVDRTADRAVPRRAGDRTRRDGGRVPRRAGGRPVSAAGSAEADQAGDGYASRSWPASGPSGRSWPRWTIPTSPACSTAAAPTQGLPFFAMEYIEGEPIDTYATPGGAFAWRTACGSSCRCAARWPTPTSTWSSIATSSRSNILVTPEGDAEAARLRHRQGAARRSATRPRRSPGCGC